MNFLLKMSRAIDRVNTFVGQSVMWIILIAVLISAGNALMRKIFSISSNAFLEIQWYLFSAIFMLAAGYTFLRNEHVRIDVITARFSARTQNWIDIIGIVFFLMPMVALIFWLSLPIVYSSIVSQEMSANFGGLIRWPVKILLPIGLFFLGLQSISELIKRIAFLRGAGPDVLAHEHEDDQVPTTRGMDIHEEQAEGCHQ